MNIRHLSRAFHRRNNPFQLAAVTGGATGVLCLSYTITHENQSRRNETGSNSFPPHHQYKTQFPLSSYRFTATAICEAVETEEQRFERILAHHRDRIDQYRKAWEYKAGSGATTATKTPSRSWPDNIPSDEHLSFMLEDMKYCSRSINLGSNQEYCNRLSFRIASALLMQFDDESQKNGMNILKQLAETGYPDAMAYYGICLNEGRAGLEPNSEEAVAWWKTSMDKHLHSQSIYELGVAKYTGEGVTEDEEDAVRLFALAAEQGHPSAAYMLGDCLLDGIGIEMDRGAALGWLVRASELGHRGARSRVMAVLAKKEGQDYGGFTDSSRQTLTEHVGSTNDTERSVVRRTTTLRKTRGDGPRNPTELLRRRTIVDKSRNT